MTNDRLLIVIAGLILLLLKELGVNPLRFFKACLRALIDSFPSFPIIMGIILSAFIIEEPFAALFAVFIISQIGEHLKEMRGKRDEEQTANKDPQERIRAIQETKRFRYQKTQQEFEELKHLKQEWRNIVALSNNSRELTLRTKQLLDWLDWYHMQIETDKEWLCPGATRQERLSYIQSQARMQLIYWYQDAIKGLTTPSPKLKLIE